MKTHPQINLRLPGDLRQNAERYAREHHFKNLQDLAKAALREKIMEKNYDESFTEKDISIIDRIIETSILKRKLHTEEELRKALK